MTPKPEERTLGKELQDFYPQNEFCELIRSFDLAPGDYILDVSSKEKIKFSRLHKRVLQASLGKVEFCDMLQHFTLERNQYGVRVIENVKGGPEAGTRIELTCIRKRWIQNEDLKK